MMRVAGSSALSASSFRHAVTFHRPRSSCAGRSRHSTQVMAAKKAPKGGKKSAQKKQGSALADLLKKKESSSLPGDDSAATTADNFASPQQYKDPEVLMLLLNICSSYTKQTGKYLMEDVDLEQLAEAIYKAPFMLLAHTTVDVPEPTFNYANRAGLQLLEYSWDQFIGMPSKYSAPEEMRAERNDVLQEGLSKGLVTIPEAVRVARSGKRVKFRDVRLFNVRDGSGATCGQAAVMEEYELEDGTVMRIQGEAPPAPLPVESAPTEEDVQAAEAAVQQQADVVRDLKEGRGLTNQDVEVQEAVAELKHRKQRVDDLKRQIQEAEAEAERQAAEDDALFDD